MKFYVLLCTLVLFSACSKEDGLNNEQPWYPENKKQVVVLLQTGTWCGACPGGANVMRNLVQEFGSQVVPIAVHGGYDDPMKISCYNNFRSDRSYSGFPSFYITEPRYGASLNNTRPAVESKLTETTDAAVAIRMTDEGDSLVFESKTAFYRDLTGSYFLSIYITEDSIFGGTGSGLYDQSGAGAEYYHDYVLRATSVEGKFWGEEIVIDPRNESLIEKTYKIERSAEWVDKNLNFSAVLWKYDASANKNYTYVNAYSL